MYVYIVQDMHTFSAALMHSIQTYPTLLYVGETYTCSYEHDLCACVHYNRAFLEACAEVNRIEGAGIQKTWDIPPKATYPPRIFPSQCYVMAMAVN